MIVYQNFNLLLFDGWTNIETEIDKISDNTSYLKANQRDVFSKEEETRMTTFIKEQSTRNQIDKFDSLHH